MVPTKEIMLGLTLATLCFPAFAETSEVTEDKQATEFLSFIAFIGSVTELESAGIDVDQLLTEPSEETTTSTE